MHLRKINKLSILLFFFSLITSSTIFSMASNPLLDLLKNDKAQSLAIGIALPIIVRSKLLGRISDSINISACLYGAIAVGCVANVFRSNDEKMLRFLSTMFGVCIGGIIRKGLQYTTSQDDDNIDVADKYKKGQKDKDKKKYG